MMSLKDQRNELRGTLFEAAQTISILRDDDSVESVFQKFLTVEHAIQTFSQYFQTGNLCSEDVRLPLECLNASNEYTVVWLHCGEKPNNDIEEEVTTKLQYVFNQIEIFDSMEKCLQFLRQLDTITTRLFLVTSCYYDGLSLGTVSPLADRNSELALLLRQFKFEHHVHGHASQWSSPNYIHSLGEIFIEAKFDDDAIKLFYDVPSDPMYQVIWLRCTRNVQLEQRLRAVFDLLEIYDDRQLCLDYIHTVDRTKMHIYFIADDPNTELECKEIVKASYSVPSANEDVNRLVLQIRSDVRNESGNPFHCIERSARRLTDKYAPFISLMAHLELYVALSRNTSDRNKMKDEMLAACRLAYFNNQAYLKVIDKFEAEYDPTMIGSAIRWYTNDSFVYRLVNQALRTGNPDIIHPYRFFINDLYAELLSIDRQYCEDFDTLIVYRGQCLTEAELKYLQNYVGQLLTLSSFTSTTIDRDFALVFAAPRETMVSVLFEIRLNITLDNTRPFAYLSSYSAMPNELEVLISMGTIFKLESIAYHPDDNIWVVVVDLCQQHSRDIKNLVPFGHNKSMDLSNFKPIPFRRSSQPAANKFDENLKQFNFKHSSYAKTIEKVASLPTLMHHEIDNSLTRTHSLRDKHGYSPEIIRCNMRSFQRNHRERKRKRYISTSCPCLPDVDCPFLQRCHSLPILTTMSENNLWFHILPRLLFHQAKNVENLESRENDEDGLFEAGIHDALLVFNYMAMINADKSVSLKEEVDQLRHSLRTTFNFQRGRWCADY